MADKYGYLFVTTPGNTVGVNPGNDPNTGPPPLA